MYARFVPETWLIYPFTRTAQAGANQREFQATDPDKPDEVLTIRTSHRDGERVYDQMLEPGAGVPFEVEFDDAIEVTARKRLPPQGQDA